MAKSVSQGVLMRLTVSVFWRVLVYGSLVGAVVGGIAGACLALTGQADFVTNQAMLFQTLISIPTTLITSFLVVNGILRSKYTDFSLQIEPSNSISETF